MSERALSTTTLQTIRNDFKLIALAALVSTGVIWFFMSMNLLWAAAAYAGFLLFMAILYAAVDHAVDASQAAGSLGSQARR